MSTPLFDPPQAAAAAICLLSRWMADYPGDKTLVWTIERTHPPVCAYCATSTAELTERLAAWHLDPDAQDDAHDFELLSHDTQIQRRTEAQQMAAWWTGL